jgi:hypothetical protein
MYAETSSSPTPALSLKGLVEARDIDNKMTERMLSVRLAVGGGPSHDGGHPRRHGNRRACGQGANLLRGQSVGHCGGREGPACGALKQSAIEMTARSVCRSLSSVTADLSVARRLSSGVIWPRP